MLGWAGREPLSPQRRAGLLKASRRRSSRAIGFCLIRQPSAIPIVRFQ